MGGSDATASPDVHLLELAAIAGLVDQARILVDPDSGADPNADVAEARRCLWLASKQLMLAAERPALGVRPDDGPTALGQAVLSAVTGIAVGGVAYACGVLLGLPAAGVVVAVLVVIGLAEWSGPRLMMRIGRVARRARVRRRWLGRDSAGHATAATVADGDAVALMEQARVAIGILAAARLLAYPDLPHTGRGVLIACESDNMLRNLRAADLILYVGSDALRRWGQGPRQ